MKLSFKRIASSMLMATAFALVGAVNVNGQTVIGSDDFDGGGVFLTRDFSSDNSANNGAFANSAFDVFGIINRATTNNSFNDDSLSIFVTDTFGLIPEAKTDSLLGIQDTIRAETDAGGVPIPEEERRLVPETLTYTFDVAGQTGLGMSFDVAAMGDFEGPDNSSGDPANGDFIVITASFDGGAATTIAQGGGDDAGMLTYTLEGGATVDFNDPFVIEGTTVTNVFQTLSFPITGTGSVLTIEMTFRFDGGTEVLAMDDLEITAGGGGGPPVVTGDFDGDGDVDCDDIDMFAGNIGSSSTTFDLTGDGTVDLSDVELHIQTLVVTSNGVTGTALGDLNCDGQVDVLGDAFPLVANLNMSGTVYTTGDIDFSGDTTVLGDAFVLVANLGFSNNE